MEDNYELSNIEEIYQEYLKEDLVTQEEADVEEGGKVFNFDENESGLRMGKSFGAMPAAHARHRSEAAQSSNSRWLNRNIGGSGEFPPRALESASQRWPWRKFGKRSEIFGFGIERISSAAT